MTILAKESKRGPLKRLNIEGLELDVVFDKVLEANAYTGMGSIATALEYAQTSWFAVGVMMQVLNGSDLLVV